jgi:hypothetical protein
MLHNLIHGAAKVVDFTREKPIDVAALAVLVDVNPITVRRWFKQGLDFCKLGGKVITSLEALNRFQRGGESQPTVQAIVVDRETLAAIKSLRKQGFKIGSEATKDDRKAKTAVG